MKKNFHVVIRESSSKNILMLLALTFDFMFQKCLWCLLKHIKHHQPLLCHA